MTLFNSSASSSRIPFPTEFGKTLVWTLSQAYHVQEGLIAFLVVVDRLSKYAHFLGLHHPFTARTTIDLFTKEIIRLNGIQLSIVTYQDPLL